MVKILTSPLQGDVPFGGHKATGLADPSAAQDAATKAYVDAVAQGLSVKASVRAASTANIASQSGLLAVDGVTLVDGDRVLAKDQTTGSTNGIWVAHSGAWTRAADADTGAELVGAFVFVEEGTTNAGSGWVQTAPAPITVGTTALTWVQFSGAGQIVAGAGLAKSGNTLRRTASATGYANLAALPSAAANNGLLERTADGGIYESDGSAWQVVRDPSGTYAPVIGVGPPSGAVATDWANINTAVTKAQAVAAAGGTPTVLFSACPYNGTTLTPYAIGTNTIPIIAGVSYRGAVPVVQQNTQSNPNYLPDGPMHFIGGTVIDNTGSTAPAMGANFTDLANIPANVGTTQIAGNTIFGLGFQGGPGLYVGAQNVMGIVWGKVDQIYALNSSDWGMRFINYQHIDFGLIMAAGCQKGGVYLGCITNNSSAAGWAHGWDWGNSYHSGLFVTTPDSVNAAKGVVIEARDGTNYAAITGGQFGTLQVNGYNRVAISQTATLTNTSANIAVTDGTKFAVGMPVVFTTSLGGFTAGISYYVASVAANVITLALDMYGSAIVASASGTATVTTKGMHMIEIKGPTGANINCYIHIIDAEGPTGIYVQATQGASFEALTCSQLVLRGAEAKVGYGRCATVDLDAASFRSRYDGNQATFPNFEPFGVRTAGPVNNGIVSLGHWRVTLTKPFLSNAYHATDAISFTSLQSPLNQLNATPIDVPNTVATNIGIRVPAGGAGDAAATIRLGIYNDQKGAPWTLVADCGTIDASATGYKDTTTSLPVTLAEGRYWLVAVTQGATTLPQVNAHRAANQGNASGDFTAQGTYGTGHFMSGVSGALPTTFVVNGQLDVAPRVVLKTS